MHKLIIIFVLLAVLIPSLATAQDDGDTPLYIECEAADYMTQRADILATWDKHWAGMATEDEQERAVSTGLIVIDSWAMLDQLRAIDADELPECVQELHQLTIQEVELQMQFFTLLITSSAANNDSFFAVEAGRKDANREAVSEDIATLLLELGWVADDHLVDLVVQPSTSPDEVEIARLFVEAIADTDIEEAAKYVCDANKDDLLAGADEPLTIEDLVCALDGEDVLCTFQSDLGLLDSLTTVELVLRMEGGKVCEIKDASTPDLDLDADAQ